MIRATFEIEPLEAAHALALRASIGMEGGPDWARARIAAATGHRAVLEFPDANWGDNVALLVSALVAGEGAEGRAVTRCRLVDLDLPDGLLPGPAFGVAAQSAPVSVGIIVKPSIGLTPTEVAEVARAAVAGGAQFIKDDEILGDPPWCPLVERVEAVAKVLPPGVVYCPNVTGSAVGVVERARRVVSLGASGVLVNAFAQGLDSLLALRRADLGVPILAHRAGSGAITRSDRFGATGAVLAGLARSCGADYWIVGAFGGALFDSDDEVRANLAALRSARRSERRSIAAFGGGLGPDGVARQAELAGGEGMVMVLGTQAYGYPGGLEAGVRAAVDGLGGHGG